MNIIKRLPQPYKQNKVKLTPKKTTNNKSDNNTKDKNDSNTKFLINKVQNDI